LKKYKWDEKYLYWGITAFLVIVSSILFFWILQRWHGIWDTIKLILKILSPFFWGMAIAYLLMPLMRILENKALLPLAEKVFKKEEGRNKRIHSFARAFSILVSVVLGVVMIVSLLWLVLPQLYNSIESVVINIQEYVPQGIKWIEETLENSPAIENFVVSIIGNISDTATNWIRNSLMPQMSNALAIVSSSLLYVVVGLANILIGITISCYITFNKEKFSAQIKKMLYSTLSEKWVEHIYDAAKCVDEAFTGFLSGKILDSLIVGIICYIACIIMKMPYPTLVSVIIGFTNIIPFFGPFIGGIPCILIIFMVSPIKGLIFAIFVILLQQFDGNVLGPKILGNSIGLNGFWVMFAIIVGNGLFGILGMICGVPVFSVIYTGIRYIVNTRLEKRGLPHETEVYMTPGYQSFGDSIPIKNSPADEAEDDTYESPKNGE